MIPLIIAGALLMPNPGPHRPLQPYPPPPPEHVPLYITGYNWEIEGGDGCDSDCSTTAIGFPTSHDLLGKVAACPSEPRGDSWVNLNLVRYIDIEGVGGFWCIDTFGAEEYRTMHWIAGIGWVYHVDLALEDPYSVHGVYYDYTLSWQWVYTVGCYTCLE